MKPSDWILDSLPSKFHFLSINHVPKRTVFLMVLNDPKLFETSPNGFRELALPRVLKFTVAPNDDAPVVDEPTPRCIWISLVDEDKSGILTQKTPCDSASLNGIPLIVIFTRVASVPLTRIPVYPTPAPASEVVTMDVAWSNKIGKSTPWLFTSIYSFEIFSWASGLFWPTLLVVTSNSSNWNFDESGCVYMFWQHTTVVNNIYFFMILG